jgi:uncharacterized Tic20 family protein
MKRMTYPMPPPSGLRVSPAEREPVVARIQQAYAEGRLDEEDLDLRLHLAMTAKSRADLHALLADLTPPVPPGPRAPTWPDPTAEQRLLAALGHLLGVVTLFIGPLIMMCTSARRSPYVREHLVAALNFQLTLLIVTIVTFGLGAIAYAVAWIVAGVAALLALGGTPFRYPFTLRIVR